MTRIVPIYGRKIAAFTISAFVLASFLITASGSSQALAQQGATFTVLAGYSDPTLNSLEIEAFLPRDLTIKVGDTVQWEFPPIEPHTVTFLSGEERPSEFVELPDGRFAVNPQQAFPSGGPVYSGAGLVNSGFVNTLPETDLTFSLTFDTPGSFEYVCLIHPQQVGSVTVLLDTAPPVFPPEIVLGNAEAERDTFIAEVQALDEQVNPDDPVTRSDGTREYEVLAGISTETTDLMYFDKPLLDIAQGDTVTWSWEASGAPHNIMFVPQGDEPPPFVMPELQDAGPPILVANPVVLEEEGGDVHDPSELLNSGVRFNPLIPAFPPFAEGGTYSLTFNEQGSFNYICSLHVAQGMIGTINVGSPRPPSVGGITLPTSMLVIAATLALSLIAFGGVLIRRRKSGSVSIPPQG